MKARTLFFFSTLALALAVSTPAVFAQSPASALWLLSTNAVEAASSVTGNITAGTEVITVATLEFGTTSSFNGVTCQRVRYYGNSWPTSITDTLAGTFVEFSVAPTAGNSLTVKSFSINLVGSSSSNMRVSCFYTTDGGATLTKFFDGNTFGSLTSGGAFAVVSTTPNVTIAATKTFRVRIYPWLNNQTSSLTGKYVALDSCVISGTTSPATSVKTGTSELPENYTLQQNYPNPFNPTTTITFQTPQSGFVSLKVFDLLGREVATLVNGELQAGTYETSFDASRLSSGVYLYELRAGSFVQTRRMMLMK
jgi:hypothetical protein